uniref:Uncharacterized protein n=1 Tax=Haplochromis burtoni TaxID=8153 RepID=A0A3Q2X2E7_HAPBU
MHRGEARSRGRFRQTPNRDFNTTCLECGKKGHFSFATHAFSSECRSNCSNQSM